MSRPGPVNRQRVVQVKYIHRHNAIELTYDDVYQAIGCLAQVENPEAHPWHEKTRYRRFYVLPCPKSMKYEYFSDIFASKPQDGQPESNHTKKVKGKPLKQIAISKKEKLGRGERREVELTEEKLEAEGDYVYRIAQLEEKLKDLEEDVDAGHDLVSQLTISHRQAKDEVEDARTTLLALRMLHKYGTTKIGVKVLGQINTDGWWEECKDKFGSNQDTFGAWQSRVDELLRKQTFNPIKVVPDGKGGIKNVVDEDDEELTKLRKGYGSLVANAVGVAALELATWNLSGRYNISMPWDFDVDHKASMSQIF